MTIDNVQTENYSQSEENHIDNSQYIVQQNSNPVSKENLYETAKKPVDKTENFNLNNFAEILDNLESSGEPAKIENDNQQQEQPESIEIPQDQNKINELINSDPILQRLNTLIESGLTQEEAEKRVYGEQYKEIPTLEKINTDNFNEPQVQQWLNVGDNEYNALKNAYNNPPDTALLYHLNNSEEYKKALGDEAGTITSLDLYNDELENLHFKKNLIEDYRRTVGVFINNIENARKQRDFLVSQQNQLQNELCTDFFKDYPELQNENPVSEKMAVHFVHRMKTKLDKLTPKDCQDPAIIKKVFNATKKDFKAIYPVLQKRFGVAPKSTINPALAQHKLGQMQTLPTAPTNSVENVNFTVSTKGSDLSDIANILDNLDKLQ